MKLLISCLLSVSEEESATCHMRPRRGGQGLEFSLFWLFVLDLRCYNPPWTTLIKGIWIYIYIFNACTCYIFLWLIICLVKSCSRYFATTFCFVLFITWHSLTLLSKIICYNVLMLTYMFKRIMIFTLHFHKKLDTHPTLFTKKKCLNLYPVFIP